MTIAAHSSGLYVMTSDDTHKWSVWDGETYDDSWYVGHENDTDLYIRSAAQFADICRYDRDCAGKKVHLVVSVDFRETRFDYDNNPNLTVLPRCSWFDGHFNVVRGMYAEPSTVAGITVQNITYTSCTVRSTHTGAAYTAIIVLDQPSGSSSSFINFSMRDSSFLVLTTVNHPAKASFISSWSYRQVDNYASFKGMLFIGVSAYAASSAVKLTEFFQDVITSGYHCTFTMEHVLAKSSNWVNSSMENLNNHFPNYCYASFRRNDAVSFYELVARYNSTLQDPELSTIDANGDFTGKNYLGEDLI